MQQPGCSNVSQGKTNAGQKRKATTKTVNDDEDDVRILAPSKKPPIQLVSYPHIDTVNGALEKTREFCTYLNAVLGQFSNEAYLYHIPPATRASVPNYLEKCSTIVTCELSGIRGLMNGVSRRMEKVEGLLMKMPFPPRDVCRKNHILNGFTPESIAMALFQFSKAGPIPTDMEFGQDDLEAIKRLVKRVENHAEVIEEAASTVPEPLEDYSRENEEIEERKRSRVEDKKLDGKKILPAKEGIVKMSYTNYHTKVMKMLAEKDVFGVEYKPYNKKHLKVIYNRIENERGSSVLNKLIEFFQLSYKAYEAIFVEGARSVFGPADVKSDVQQHLAQICHYFNVNVSSTPLL